MTVFKHRPRRTQGEYICLACAAALHDDLRRHPAAADCTKLSDVAEDKETHKQGSWVAYVHEWHAAAFVVLLLLSCPVTLGSHAGLHGSWIQQQQWLLACLPAECATHGGC